MLGAESSKNRVYVTPKFEKSQDEFCDVLWLSVNDAAVCIEAKGSMFKASAKYGGNLLAEMQKKRSIESY